MRALVAALLVAPAAAAAATRTSSTTPYNGVTHEEWSEPSIPARIHVAIVDLTSAEITLREVLEIFFVVHDPTTLNRQGNDVGTQYRSGIYFTDAEQERVAREVRAEADAAHKGRVVTEVKALANYSKAEAYHQHYYARNPGQGYCAFVVGPKVEKFKKTFKARLRTVD